MTMKDMATQFVNGIFNTTTNCELDIELRQPADDVQIARLAKLSLNCERSMTRDGPKFKRTGTMKLWVCDVADRQYNWVKNWEDFAEALTGVYITAEMEGTNIWLSMNFTSLNSFEEVNELLQKRLKWVLSQVGFRTLMSEKHYRYYPLSNTLPP